MRLPPRVIVAVPGLHRRPSCPNGPPSRAATATAASRLRRPRRAGVGALLAAGLLGACGDAPQPVLTAGEIGYTAAEVPGLTDDRLRLLGEITVFALAVADSTLPELGRPWIEAQLSEVRWHRLQAQRMLDSAGVGEEVLRARYRTAPALELTVRHLLVFSARYEPDATRAEARAKAEAALARIRSGEPFARVAAEVSDEPGAESREGLLTPGREGSWVDEFWNAATLLEPGEVSEVVETQYGFHVLRLEARDTVPFDEVRDAVALEVARLMRFRPADSRPPPLPGALPPPPVPADLFDATLADSILLAEGDGWEVRLGDVRDAAALLPRAEWENLPHDPAAMTHAWQRAVEQSVANSLADAAGVTTDDGDRAAAEREFIEQAEQWAHLLGLGESPSPEAIRSASLRALSVSGQNASLTRDALRATWGGLLHRFRPIRIGETSPGPEA